MATRLNLSDTDTDKVVQAYVNDEVGLGKIAAMLNCTSPTVARILRSKGVRIRPRGRRKTVNGNGAA